MSKTPEITEKQIRARASETSFSRGQQYYKQEAIFNTVKRGSDIVGHCQGSMPYPYQIRVTFGKQGIVNTACNCEYDYGGDCKHIVALLLTYIREPELFMERPSIEDTLNERSKEELIALIRKMVDRYPDLQMLVDLPTPGKPTSIDVDMLQRQMRQAFQPRYDSYGDHTGDGISVLYTMTETAAEFAEHGDWKNASVLYRAILEECLNAAEIMLDDEGHFTEGVNHTAERLAACLDMPELADDVDERRDILEKLLQVFIWDVNFGGIGIGDDVPDLVLRYLRTDDLPYIRKQIENAQKRRQTQSYSGWGQEVYEKFLIELDILDNIDPNTTLERLRENELFDLLAHKLIEMKRYDEAISEIEAHIFSPYERLRILPALVSANQINAAIRLANQTLAKQYNENLIRWLLEVLRQQGSQEAYLTVQVQRMQQSPHIHHYIELKEAAVTLGTWDDIRANTLKDLEKQQRYDIVTQIYLNEEAWDLAWNTLGKLKQVPRQFSWENTTLELQVAQRSMIARPEKSLAVFLRHVRPEIDRRERTAYAAAAELLTHIRDLYRRTNQEAEWEKYIAGLRAEFKRLPALQDELNKARL